MDLYWKRDDSVCIYSFFCLKYDIHGSTTLLADHSSPVVFT